MHDVELVGLRALHAHGEDLEPPEALHLVDDFGEIAPLIFGERLFVVDFEGL